jgi:hypothetical protein
VSERCPNRDDRLRLSGLRGTGRRPRGRYELLYAGIQHLIHVEFEPYTVHLHGQGRDLASLDPPAYARWRTGDCLDMRILRQFADVCRGSVTGKTWQELGGSRPCGTTHCARSPGSIW